MLYVYELSYTLGLILVIFFQISIIGFCSRNQFSLGGGAENAPPLRLIGLSMWKRWMSKQKPNGHELLNPVLMSYMPINWFKVISTVLQRVRAILFSQWKSSLTFYFGLTRISEYSSFLSCILCLGSESNGTECTHFMAKFVNFWMFKLKYEGKCSKDALKYITHTIKISWFFI